MSMPDLQVLKESIPAKVRRGIYATYVGLVVVDGGAAAAYAAVPAALPTPLVIAAAVLLYLGVPIGTLAAVNVQPAPAEVHVHTGNDL